MEGVYRKKKDAARELITKEKKGLIVDQDIFWGEENGKGFIVQIASSFYGVMGVEGQKDGVGPRDSDITLLELD